MLDIDQMITASQWSDVSKASQLAISVAELKAKGKDPARIRQVGIKVAGHAVMVLRVTPSATHRSALTGAQAQSYSIDCLPSVGPSISYWIYDVETSGMLPNPE